MNSASRLLTIIKELETRGNYFSTVKSLFKIDDTYSQLMFFQYFLKDTNNVKTILEQRGKYNKIFDNKLINITSVITPNYDLRNRKHIISSSLEDLHMWNCLFDDEKIYESDIEKLKLQLNSIEKTGTFLDDFIKEIDEAVKYYSFFGEMILDDKFNDVYAQSFIKKDKIIELAKKHKKAVTIILNFFDVYIKIKKLPEHILLIVNDVKKAINYSSDEEVIDAELDI